MKVLHVISSLARELGGPSQACVGMAEAVSALGHDVRICTSKYDGFGKTLNVASDQPVQRNGVTYYYYDMLRSNMRAPRVPALSVGMIRALPRLIADVDVVHLHSLYLPHTWATGSFARRRGVPYIVRPHGTLDPYIYRRHRVRKWIVETIFQNRVNRNASAFHFTTEEEMELARPYIFGRPGFVAPLGVDLRRLAKRPAPGYLRARFPELGDRDIVLFYGRLDFKKGLDILIPAFADAVARGQDLALVIAGPDHGMEAKAREWVSEHGVADRCIFTGMLDGEAAVGTLCDADLFVLPSYSENFGISVIEAMACGLPVLISNKVNIWREVEADGAGLASPPEVSAFSAGISRLMGDPERRAAMAAAARASVAHRFSWDQIGRRLVDVYTAIKDGERFEPLMPDFDTVPGEAA